MARHWYALSATVLAGLACAAFAQAAQTTPPPSPRSDTPAATSHYFPPAGRWERRPPADVGMDESLLAAAVEWACGQAADLPADFSTQRTIFGTPLGPVPTSRAATNGVVVRRGYIVAQWGDVDAVDPSYSMAKSYLSTLLGLALDRGLIADIDQRVGETIHDGGYDSEHNARITWRHHATQTSEWQGEMFGKSHQFLGREDFGQGEMKPRPIAEPGTRYEYNDVRINRFSLSLMRTWNRPLPDVLRAEIMDPIGASTTWVYHGYDNSTVEVDGIPMICVSGGTRWGGGLWMSTMDHARFGYLILRRGLWADRRLLSESWIDQATRPQGVKQDYGYLWWLNTQNAWPAAPAEAFAAQGAGSNVIWIDPADDLLIVWRWHRRADQAEFIRRVLDAVRR